ncbi:MAG: cobyrinate a,c-diamide synthase [Thermodesulfobacteriota bacterium]|nr:cobyrinate a,c-diamide synthase [Thermodesulfobacteriota bacterium]
MRTRALVIAGTHSGCGKTLVSLGVMAALMRRGFTVQAFKAGPDFIDPGYHQRVTGRPSHNLDGWIMGQDKISEVFSRYACHADVSVVEGVMGLFDGLSGKNESGSTAQLAKWLGLPVVLVADARSMARSAAALVKGYAEFDPDLALAGVVFNKTGGENHNEILEQAMLGLPEVPALGFLPRNEDLTVASRHLGLITAKEHGLDDTDIDCLALWMEENMNPGRLLSALPEKICSPPPAPETKPQGPRIRIGVALDEAFCFYYHENFRLLEQAGAELVFFSPLNDLNPPPNLNGLYLGGGYPELHAPKLAANKTMLQEIRAFKGPIYAECGGFMYLMETLEDLEGRTWPMAGLFRMRAKMANKFQALGYREIVTNQDSLFGPAWTMLRGHEFHYSHPVSLDEDAGTIYKVMDKHGWTDRKEGFARENALGSYVHLHFASNPDAADEFVKRCGEGKEFGGKPF